MAVTNRISRRLLSTRKISGGTSYSYAGVVDYVGGRSTGAYIDNKTSYWNNTTCNYVYANSCNCCGNDGPPYYNCYDCNLYRVDINQNTAVPSSSFSSSPTKGYYDSATNKGFRKFAVSGLYGAWNITTEYQTCGTNCAGYDENWFRNNTNYEYFGYLSYAAIKDADGTLWTWGYNNYGQLGNGNTTNRYSPVQVGSNSWKTVIGGASDYFIAIRSDDTLWAWGYNPNGQLGDGTYTSRSSPVQILGSWKFISAGMAASFGIKSDDTLWGWGTNGNGQLGDNTTTQRNSPVQVSGGGAWKFVHTDGYWSTFAIKTNGTAFSWGYNGYAHLGHSSFSNVYSPVQINGGYSDWTYIGRPYHANTYGIRSNGTAWAWGLSPYGLASAYYYSPTQIGSSTDHASGSNQTSFYGYCLDNTYRYSMFTTTAGNLVGYRDYNSTRTTLYSGGGAVEHISSFNYYGSNIYNGNWIIKYIV